MQDRDSYLIQEAYEDVRAKEAIDFLLRLVPQKRLEINHWDLGHNETLSDVDMDKIPFTFQDIIDSVEKERHSRIIDNPKSLIQYGKMVDVKKREGKKIYFAKVVYPVFYRKQSEKGDLVYDFDRPEGLTWVIFRISKNGIEQFNGGDYGDYSPFYEYRREKIEGIDKTNPFK